MVSIVSLTAVVAATGLTIRFSKLPPLAAVMVADTLPAPGDVVAWRGDACLPLLAPAAMVIIALLDSVTLTGLCAALVNDAV